MNYNKKINLIKNNLKEHVKTINLVEIGNLKKGDVLTVAKIAAIQASKKTSDLIPLCHNINLNGIDIEFKIANNEKKFTANQLFVVQVIQALKWRH